MYVCIYISVYSETYSLSGELLRFIEIIIYFDAQIAPDLANGSFLKLVFQKATGTSSLLVPVPDTLEPATYPSSVLFVLIGECHLKVKICGRCILVLLRCCCFYALGGQSRKSMQIYT